MTEPHDQPPPSAPEHATDVPSPTSDGEPAREPVPWVGILVVSAALVGTLALWMMPLRHPAFWPTAAVVALAVVGGTWFGKRTGR